MRIACDFMRFQKAKYVSAKLGFFLICLQFQKLVCWNEIVSAEAWSARKATVRQCRLSGYVMLTDWTALR